MKLTLEAAEPVAAERQEIAETLFSRDEIHDLPEKRPESGVLFKSPLDVPPGHYVLRMIARDSEGQLMSARNSVVEIP
jgi:hypothetical protein